MGRKELQDLIHKDQLNDAVKLLLEIYPSGKKAKSAKLLKGRLTELNRQNNEGTISIDSYNLEMNRIRAALIDVVESENENIQANKLNYIPIIAGIVVLALVAIGSVYFINRPSESEPVSQTENSAGLPVGSLLENPIEAVQKIKTAIGVSAFTYKHSELPLKEEQLYKAGLARLKRQYTWETDIVLEIPEDATMVTFDDIHSQVNIKVKKVQLAPYVYVRNKKSTTITNNLWIEETSQDGKFWENANSLTKTKLNQQVKENPELRKALFDSIKSMVLSRIDSTNTAVEIRIEKLHLYNGEALDF